jgi:hypothetical protein
MSSTLNKTATQKAKRAILNSPEVQDLLNSIWDGQMVIVVDKVKGKLKVVSIELREDDLVEELLQPV